MGMTMAENNRQSNHYDVHISRKLRTLRRSLGLSQKELADMMDVTYQQAHKYERNVNRIPAGRLGLLASRLKIPVQYFYEGLDNDTIPSASHGNDTVSTSNREDVIEQFRSITNQRQRDALHHLIRSLAEE